MTDMPIILHEKDHLILQLLAPELQKLELEERVEYVKMMRIPPHDWTEEDSFRWTYFADKINPKRATYETMREMAKIPQEMYCEVIRRSPYVIVDTLYGRARLPNSMVPKELMNPPEDCWKDLLFAIVSLNVDNRIITYFEFTGYLQKTPMEEMARIKGIGV